MAHFFFCRRAPAPCTQAWDPARTWGSARGSASGLWLAVTAGARSGAPARVNEIRKGGERSYSTGCRRCSSAASPASSPSTGSWGTCGRTWETGFAHRGRSVYEPPVSLVVTTQFLPRVAVTGVCLASCVVCVARPRRARYLPKTRAGAPEWAPAVTASHNPETEPRATPCTGRVPRLCHRAPAPCTASAHVARGAARARGGTRELALPSPDRRRAARRESQHRCSVLF